MNLLIQAAAAGNLEKVNELIESAKQNQTHDRGALNRMVSQKGALGQTPLLVAAENGYEGIVGILLEAGAAVDQANSSGNTPLLQAAQQGHEAIVAALLEAGAAVDQANSSGNTPLHWAAEKAHEAIVGRLLAAGAAVDQANKVGQTPLHWAASEGHEAVVRRLLQAGAAVDQADEDGNTPLGLVIGKRDAKFIIFFAYYAFKALEKHEAGGARAAGEQSSEGPEVAQAKKLKDKLENLLTESPGIFTPSQAALLQWIIGKHVVFQDEGGPTEADLIKKIKLDDLKALMTPEKDLAALSTASKAFMPRFLQEDAFQEAALPAELIDQMRSYLTQDPLLEKLKNQLIEREAAATEIQRHLRGWHVRRAPPASEKGGGGAAAKKPNPAEAGAKESKGPGAGSS